MNESKLSKLIRDSLAQACKAKELLFLYQRIESHATSQGIPDVYVCIDGVSFWLELKIWPNQPTNLQHGWLITYANAGGIGFVVTHGEKRTELGHYSKNGVYSATYVSDSEIGLNILYHIGK